MGDLMNPPAPAAAAIPGQPAPPQQPMGWGEKLTNLISNPLVGTALTGYFGAIGAPKLSGFGGALSRGGLTAMANLPQLMQSQRQAQLEPLQVAAYQQNIQKGAQDIELNKQKMQAIADLPADQRSYALAAPQMLPTIMQHQWNIAGNQQLGSQLQAMYTAHPDTPEGQFAGKFAGMVSNSAVPISPQEFWSAYSNNQELQLRDKLTTAQVKEAEMGAAEKGAAIKLTNMQVQAWAGMTPDERIHHLMGDKQEMFYNPQTKQWRKDFAPEPGEVPESVAKADQDTRALWLKAAQEAAKEYLATFRFTKPTGKEIASYAVAMANAEVPGVQGPKLAGDQTGQLQVAAPPATATTPPTEAPPPPAPAADATTAQTSAYREAQPAPTTAPPPPGRPTGPSTPAAQPTTATQALSAAGIPAIPAGTHYVTSPPGSTNVIGWAGPDGVVHKFGETGAAGGSPTP